MEAIHRQYMERCLELAVLGRYFTAPNPMVGCVVVLEGKIIAEGYHQKYGMPHAEREALDKIETSRDLSNATFSNVSSP